MAGSDSRSVGQRSEKVALDHLTLHGLQLLVRNFHCRYGEIDLVMRDGAAIVFVEVRFRKHGRFASAAASVDARKQGKLLRAAAYYLQKHPQFSNSPARFDVVALDGPTLQQFTIQWLRDAFRPGE